MKKKMKYIGGITRIITCKVANRNKQGFRKVIQGGYKEEVSSKVEPKYEIFSLAGTKTFEEQVLSIFSYIKHAGTPIKWSVYSDGTLSDEEQAYLSKLYSFVEVKEWSYCRDAFRYDIIDRYASDFILGKKLYVVLNHQYNGQTFFVDSDIVFYSTFKYYLDSGAFSESFWYKPDAIYLQPKTKLYYPEDTLFNMNSGFFVINGRFNTQYALNYLEGLNGEFDFFSEQNCLNYAFKMNHASLLDPRVFIVDGIDQFDFGYAYGTDEIALRHFIGPIRHKMWQKGWKWHLK